MNHPAKILHPFRFFILLALATAWIAAPSFIRAADLSKDDIAFLAAYEKAHAALVDDNLDLVKKSAESMGDPGRALAASANLKEARSAFAALSKTAVTLAAGQPGYYILHCPMVNLDWVQTSPAVANPFGGAEMRACGVLKK
jgi:hypothetical protein